MKPFPLLFAFVFSPLLWAQDFTSSDIADATERLTGKRAHMSHEIRLLAGGTVAGPAVTMKVVRDENAESLAEGLKAIRIVESAPRGSVIVLAVEGDGDFAILGATFATLAQSRDLAGFVVDGSMRGLREFHELGFPLFARGTVAGSAGGHFRLEAANIPVRCGGVGVSPGDFVVGDADGVAVVPKDVVSDVMQKARALRLEKEELLPLIAKHQSYIRAMEELRRKREAPKPPEPDTGAAAPLPVGARDKP